MSLIFYYAPMSTAVVSHWVLEELGIPYEKVKLDISKGDTKAPDYLKINPSGLVPTVVHDGTPIFESAAIAIYLGTRWHGARAEVLELQAQNALLRRRIARSARSPGPVSQ